MPGNILDQQITTVAMSVAALQSLAASQTWVAGWFSDAVDNSANDYLDYMVSGSFVTAGANRQAGSINVFVLGSLNDTPLWPVAASGTIGSQGAGAFGDPLRRASFCRQLVGIEVDTGISSIFAFPPTGIRQLFGREMPTHWGLFVAHNASTTTTAGLASSGNALWYTPKYRRYT